MPDTEIILKMAIFFAVSVDYLLDRTNERTTVDKIKTTMASNPDFAQVLDKLSTRKDLQELFKTAKYMQPEKVKLIIRIIEAM